MKHVIKFLLTGLLLLCLVEKMPINFLMANESEFYNEKRKDEIEHVFEIKLNNVLTHIGNKKKEVYAYIYILTNGLSFYSYDYPCKRSWQVGDTLIYNSVFFNPLSYQENEDLEETFITVKNLSQKDKKRCLVMGWASPKVHTIVDKSREKRGGEKIVKITLDDGSSWEFAYCDEHPYAKHWKVKERVILFANRASTQNPFLSSDSYSSKFGYEVFNLDSHYPLVSVSAKFVP